MTQHKIALSVSDAAERLKTLLTEKGFSIFADINHRENARSVDLDMEESRVLIFGSPVAGTKLMHKDISMSLDLPLRLAIVKSSNDTLLLHQDSEYYTGCYDVKGHPVLEKIDELYASLLAELAS
jgi:uncharacterized protein (DUF302 family)